MTSKYHRRSPGALIHAASERGLSDDKILALLQHSKAGDNGELEVALLQGRAPSEATARVAASLVRRNPGGAIFVLPEQSAAWGPYWSREDLEPLLDSSEIDERFFGYLLAHETAWGRDESEAGMSAVAKLWALQSRTTQWSATIGKILETSPWVSRYFRYRDLMGTAGRASSRSFGEAWDRLRRLAALDFSDGNGGVERMPEREVRSLAAGVLMDLDFGEMYIRCSQHAEAIVQMVGLARARFLAESVVARTGPAFVRVVSAGARERDSNAMELMIELRRPGTPWNNGDRWVEEQVGILMDHWLTLEDGTLVLLLQKAISSSAAPFCSIPLAERMMSSTDGRLRQLLALYPDIFVPDGMTVGSGGDSLEEGVARERTTPTPRGAA